MMRLKKSARQMIHGRSDDRGASAILVALSAVVLVGFAALAVDSGVLFSDRRQQQSAADGGALAAVQFARTQITADCSGSGASLAACRGAEEAIAVVNGTLNNRYSDADWAACTDPNTLPFSSSLSSCISYINDGLQEARVLLPGTDVNTPFGGVIGTSSARVGALAHAKADVGQSADILPFAVGPTGAGQAQSCLFAQSTAQLDISPCEASDSGNFGKLDLSIYGNSTLGTAEQCGNANPQGKMAVNIAVGADHPLEEAPETTGTVEEIGNCPVITNPVDNIPTQTGNARQGLTEGLFQSISNPSLEGRLRCKDGDAGEPPNKTSAVCEYFWNHPSIPETIDDTPLWDFIDSSNDLVGTSCPTSGIADRAAMEACLTAWKGLGSPSNPLFIESIQTAPRFAAVPILDTDPSGGSGDYDIIDFKPVYLETVYMNCTANSCDTIHSPGEDNPAPPGCPDPVTPLISHCGVGGSGNPLIQALTSFVLDLDMLPNSIRDNFPGQPGTIVFNLSK